MLSFLLPLLIVALGHCDDDATLRNALSSPTKLGALFKTFTESHSKHYPRSETKMRLKIFQRNARNVLNHNLQKTSWTETLNKFSDLTGDEMGLYLGLNTTGKSYSPRLTSLSVTSVPDSGSWIEKGAVTPVKDQMACGSCWSFGAVGTVEGVYKASTGVLRVFSEKQVLDCTYSYDGCQGGWMKDGVEGIVSNNNNILASMADYPYAPVDTTCYMNKPDAMVGAKIVGYVDVPYGESYTIASLTTSVITVAFYVSDTFSSYASGIYRDETSGKPANHALLAVAYTPSYILIKNSWGLDWGDRGFIKMARNYYGCAFHTYVGYVEMYDTGVTDTHTGDAPTSYDAGVEPIPDPVCKDTSVSCRSSWCHSSYYKKKCQSTCGLCV